MKSKLSGALLSVITVILFFQIFIPSFLVVAVQDSDNQSYDSNSMQEHADNITNSCVFFAKGNELGLNQLFDDDLATRWLGGDRAFVEIVSPTTEIGAIFIKWNYAPSPFNLSSKGKPNGSGGNDNFIQEYVTLSTPSNSLRLDFIGESSAIAEIIVFSKGERSPNIPVWQPPLEKSDLLVVSAHGDDEYLWFGATIPYYAKEMRYRVQLTYLIRHGSAPRYEYLRIHEILDGLWYSGVTNYPIFSDFNDEFGKDLDKFLETHNMQDYIDFITETVRKCKPEVIVSHGEEGEYGHVAHKISSLAVKASVRSGDANFHPPSAERFGVWDTKKIYLHSYDKKCIKMDWDAPIPAFSNKSGFEVAKEAYSFHKSQLHKNFRVASDDHEHSSYKFGLYHSSVGDDVLKNDFFEHVALTPLPPATAPTTMTITTTTTEQPTTTTTIAATTKETEPTIFAINTNLVDVEKKPNVMVIIIVIAIIIVAVTLLFLRNIIKNK